MAGARYICRVIKSFGSAGPAGLVLHEVGDEVVREREPIGSTHLELVRVENPAPEFLTNPDRTEFQATQPSDEREALREALMDRGITPDNRWGIARLQSELAKVKA